MEFVLVVIVGILWLVTSSSLKKIRQALEELQAANRLREDDSHRAQLIRRVYELERAVERLQTVNAAPEGRTPEPVEMIARAAVAAPVPVVPETAPPIPQPVVLEPPVEQLSPAPVTESEIEAAPALPPPTPLEPEQIEQPDFVPSPTWKERLATSMAGTEWEAILGGSLLNKLGVLVLIIGIGLFLGYSFTRMGPAGRVATALTVSGAMLAGGILVERRSLYRVFGRGLIGGGWAGLYFTTYAAYALPPAKVVESPWLASVLLAAVAAGLIVHSMKYRSQAVTGLAYFIAFATFVLTPVTTFAVLALLPLAASLLYLAHRFDWYNMALFGVLATYGTCASRGDSGASVAAVQGLVASYWLLFETFVVLRASKPGRFSIPEQLIFPFNMLGLVALSLPKWQSAAPKQIYVFLAGAAVLTLLGAIARGWVRPPSSDPESSLLPRMASGGYEGPITLTALFLALALFQKLTTVWINAGLLVEAQLFVLAGLYLRQAYLHRVGAAVFGVATAKLLANDAPYGGLSRYGKLAIQEWSPVAAAAAALMYLNRRLIPTAKYFSFGATLAATLVLGFESPRSYVTVAWFAFAALLLELGLRRRLTEFRIQSYILAGMALAAVIFNNLTGSAAAWSWIPVGAATLIAYVMCLRVTRLPDRLNQWERDLVPIALSFCTTICAIVFAALAAPPKFIGAAWTLLAAVMLELGLRNLPSQFRLLSFVPLVLGWLQVYVICVAGAQKDMPTVARLNLGVAALMSYAIAARLFRLSAEAMPARVRSLSFPVSSFAGTIFLSTLMWVVLPNAAVAIGWTILSLALVETGLECGSTVLRVQGDLLAGVATGRLFLANFVNMGSTLGISHRLLTVLPIIASQYFSWWRRISLTERPRWDRIAERVYLYAAPVLAVLLMRFELGRVLTVAGWAAITVLLFWFGVRKSNFDFRLQAYVLAILCFWRSWTTNFYVPDSFAGMPGRVATAALVVIALYASEFLAPRDGFVHDNARSIKRWLERYPRAFFSVLASLLVAILLRYEVSGGMLTVAWGIQASVLLAAGFWARERVLRISGLLLFLNCILKLFLYDLRNLETMNRILSFIVLGAVMVGVSWIYTRFRGQIQKYL